MPSQRKRAASGAQKSRQQRLGNTMAIHVREGTFRKGGHFQLSDEDVGAQKWRNEQEEEVSRRAKCMRGCVAAYDIRSSSCINFDISFNFTYVPVEFKK